jgi:hypothetical protein
VLPRAVAVRWCGEAGGPCMRPDCLGRRECVVAEAAALTATVAMHRSGGSPIELECPCADGCPACLGGLD